MDADRNMTLLKRKVKDLVGQLGDLRKCPGSGVKCCHLELGKGRRRKGALLFYLLIKQAALMLCWLLFTLLHTEGKRDTVRIG